MRLDARNFRGSVAGWKVRDYHRRDGQTLSRIQTVVSIAISSSERRRESGYTKVDGEMRSR